MPTYASPTFLSSNNSRMGGDARGDFATDSQLRMQPYLCVSYDKEEDFYQPMRLLNAALIGPLLLVAATQVKSDLLKVVTGGSGLVLMFGSGIRYYEAYEEMTRYREAFAQKESR
jgi:hypothetical protein